MKTLSIELPDDSFERLAALARVTGTSPEAYAAQMLNADLANGEANWIRLEIGKLREDIAIATQAILLNNCDVNEAEARRWISEKLLNR